MGICPKCKQEISTLMQYAEACVYREVGTSGDGGLISDNWNVDDVAEDGAFCCPECGEELTYDEDEAYELIKDDDDD
jgi:hypothetical protein